MKQKRILCLGLLIFCVWGVRGIDSRIDTLEGYVQLPVVHLDDDRAESDYFQEGVLQVYFLKRLTRAAHTLAIVHEKNLFPCICEKNPNCFVFDETLIFLNEEIEECKQAIVHNKSLQPFFDLWESVEHRVPQLSAEFFRELSLLVLGIYKAIYMAYSPLIQVSLQKNIVLQAITLLCGNLSKLHAFELLNIIEKLTVQIPKLLEKYELTKSDLTWKQWLTKYWWLPPVAASALALESVFIYQIAVGARKLPRMKNLLRALQNKTKKPIAIENANAT